MRTPHRLCLFALLAVAASANPEQLSLALTENGPSEMSITWASLMPYAAATSSGKVTWQLASGGPPSTAAAVTSTYSASLGWSGTLFRAVMTGLTPGARYSYSVTDASGNSSQQFTFNAAPALPAAGSAAHIAVLGDMGTVQLFGWATAAALVAEHAVNPFDLTLIAGDLSYATVSPPNGIEIQSAWDSWCLQNQPFAATAPFMMTVGNHESTPGTTTNSSGGPFPLEYAAFTARFRMPANGGSGNYFYHYSIGPAFFVSVDGEHDISVGSAQHAWLAATLAAVDRSVHPWLFAVMHHPVLSSDSDEAPDHTPGGPRSVALEPLFLQYKVDVVFQGHQVRARARARERSRRRRRF